MSTDLPAAHRLSNELTSACAFAGPGDISALVDTARDAGVSDTTVALGLVLYAQNAAWNGADEGDRAALQTAGEIARLIATPTRT